MCRLAAYTGSELPLARFLLEPPHSLYRQSWLPREMREAVVNADGFGIGWHAGQNGGQNRQRTAQCYLHDKPIWSDVNLPVLAESLHSDTWAANVRSATPGQAVHAFNSQPFVVKAAGNGPHDDWLFLHNGFVENFNPQGREIMLRLLPADVVASLRGSTDSAFISALLQQQLAGGSEPLMALHKTARLIADNIGSLKAMLNLVICRPKEIYALRHSIGEHCASLYSCHNGKAFPDSHLCASEALNDDANWREVPEHSLLKCVGDDPAEHVALSRI